MRRLWLKLFSHLVEIDLLLPKSERLSIPERNQFHAQGGGVKGDSCVDAGYGENKMVETIDNESHTHTLMAGSGRAVFFLQLEARTCSPEPRVPDPSTESLARTE
jgi:hypothetical protein